MSNKIVTLEYVNFHGNSYSSNETIYGQQIAETQLVDAFLEHNNNIYNYLYVPNTYEHIAATRKEKKYKNKLQLIDRMEVMSSSKKYSTDIFHSVSQNFDNMCFFRNRKFLKQSPITFTLHCASKPHLIMDVYYKMLLSPFHSYDSLICTSNASKQVVKKQLDYMAEKFSELYGGKIKYNGRLDVIPLGVDTSFFKPMNQATIRYKYNIPQDSFVILWLGRLSCYDKADLLQLFRVTKVLVDKNKRKIKLVLVGNDNKVFPYIADIRKQIGELGIEKNVLILDEYDVSKRNEIYNMADVFTSPIDNLQETFGITPIEAMSCGIPQIVSAWDGYKDSVINNETGFLIDTTWYQYNTSLYEIPDETNYLLKDGGYIQSHYVNAQSVVLNEEAYVKAFQKLIDYPELLHSMKEKSRQVAIEKYDWENVISMYDELWDELLEKANKEDGCERDFEKLELLRINHYNTFQSYPSNICTQDLELMLSDKGRDVCKKIKQIINNSRLDSIFMNYKLAEKILNVVWQKQKVRLSQLPMIFLEYEEGIVKSNAVILIKRGYITSNIIS